ncbi:MAG TPA: tetratricopeptide repeat protein [Desulfobulbaceae bacterium]|nr:tetratricopeptide repeat protein [Desulfobulbaceae bacterium]
MINFAKILPLFLFLLALPDQQTWAGSILNQVTLTTETSRMQVFLRFSELPTYRVETQGKRIDLVLTDTVPAKTFAELPGNDKMIKMIKKKQPEHLLLSFYFRYPPQNVRTRQIPETSSLMLDILLGNPLSARYPDLSARLHGITLLNRKEIDFTNPLYASDYGTDWRLFIRTYENKVIVRPKLHFSLPPFPLAAALPPKIPPEQWLQAESIALSKQKAWQQASEAIKTQLELEENEGYRKRLLLSYAECLVRGGEYQVPYNLLQQIGLTYPDTTLATFARLLFLYAVAKHKDPYLPSLELAKLRKLLKSNNPLVPYLNIFQAELALETGRINQAVEILKRDDIAYLGRAKLLRLLRQADTYFDSGETIKALVAYQNLDKQGKIIDQQPRSLALYSDALYTYQRFKEAAKKYHLLVKLLSGTDMQPLAMFRLAMSKLHSGEKWTGIFPLFSHIQNAFPKSEGDFRARLKMTDIKFLKGTLPAHQASATYGQTGESANLVQLREEALVKQAMVNALTGQHETSITQAMQILRDFRHGSLKVETRALIISQLPDTLKEMIAGGRYIAALVLAKQNRLFFARGWLGIDLLYDLARAYEQLGAFDRAVRAYQYILEVSTEEEHEKVYLPMITALYNSGRYELVEDYANRFFSRFTDSPKAADIFLLRVKALMQNGDLKIAMRLLAMPDRPSTPEIEQTATKIYFEQHQWDKVIKQLSGNELSSWSGGERDYMLAESLFQNGQYEKSIPILMRLREEDPYGDQAMFRLAEIYSKTGKPETALKQFQQLAEKGKDPHWKKLAKEEISILQLKVDAIN